MGFETFNDPVRNVNIEKIAQEEFAKLDKEGVAKSREELEKAENFAAIDKNFGIENSGQAVDLAKDNLSEQRLKSRINNARERLVQLKSPDYQESDKKESIAEVEAILQEAKEDLINKEVSRLEVYADPANAEKFLKFYKNDISYIAKDVLDVIYPAGSYFERGDKNIIIDQVAEKLAQVYDKKLPGFADQYLAIKGLYDRKLAALRSADKELDAYTADSKLLASAEQCRNDFLEAINQGNPRNLSEQEINDLGHKYHEIIDQYHSELETKTQEVYEKYNVQGYGNLFKQRLEVKSEQEEACLSMINKLNNPTDPIGLETFNDPALNVNIEKIVQEEFAKSDKEKKILSAEEIVSQRFLYKDTQPERAEINEAWARNEKGELKENINNYALAYGEMLTENAEKLGDIRKYVRDAYNKTMNQLGLDSSPAGQSDTWIDWDLSKQKFLAQHPEQSNENYELADPLKLENLEILTEIIDRHVGWEVMNHEKYQPGFLETLDKNKESFAAISSLLKESRDNPQSKLHSYQLAELGRLVQENKGI